MSGCVYLVGGGCGSAELITRRGWALLRRCDVLIYDDLLSEELLDAVSTDCERIYVGKRQGCHSTPQEEINALLLAKAREGKTVVRLKGGDPFVFGRGGEELLALRAAGLPYEEVPGVTSAVAIPALAGIPVTHRGMSRSIHIVTTHTKDSGDGLPEDLESLARLHGTLVFLMGLNRLSLLTERLLAFGMDPATPAAVTSSAPTLRTVRGSLADIAKRVREARLSPPAVIVVGRTAALDLTPVQAKPLAGVLVGITGTDAAGKLRPLLEEQGAQVFRAQRSLVEPCPFSFQLSELCNGAPRWVVLTSVNGVELFFRHLEYQKIDLRRLQNCRFAVIGAATKAALAGHGIYAELCPKVYTSEALGKALRAAVHPGETVELFRALRGSRRLYEILAEVCEVRETPLYDLRSDRKTANNVRLLLERADYLTFSSASGVEFFLKAHGTIPNKAVCVCIGDVTEKALRKVYRGTSLTATDISAGGIVQTILKHRRQTADKSFTQAAAPHALKEEAHPCTI